MADGPWNRFKSRDDSGVGGKPWEGFTDQSFSDEVVAMKPLTNQELQSSEHFFRGNKAVSEVERREGELSLGEKRVLELEGFVDVPYLDTKGVVTIGVGQTGKFIKETYKESFKTHEDRTKKRINNYDSLPEEVKAELVQAEYRGDLGGSPKFIKLFNAGKFKEASEEFLDNRDFRENKPKNNSISKRMEAVSRVVGGLAE